MLPVLPVHLTGFVGRLREVTDVEQLLGTTRLLTLTGAGGSGKTRLARAVAERRVAAGDDARLAWADLTPLDDAALLGAQVAAALGVPVRADVPALEAVRLALGTGRALLVLDNCEHLLAACAEAADLLLRGCPGLTVLATSRGALGVAGEAVWLVPGLAPEEARALFAARAGEARPGFVVTEANAAAADEICRRLDGIPLAIELAVARVRVLDAEQIAARLDDVFRVLAAGARTALPRHRTLRATMDWSHALLGERERVLLRRLSVFAGGFTLEAAEAVCADDDPLGADDVLDGVAALVDRALVVADSPATPASLGTGASASGASDADTPEPRYRLLETVRQYARDHLEAADEVDRMAAAHARYFLALAERLAPPIEVGQPAPAVVAQLAADRHNLRAAAARLIAAAARDPAGGGAPLMRFAAALFWYWYAAGSVLTQGQFGEARACSEAAMRAAGAAAAEPVVHARALVAAGFAAYIQGDYAAACARLTAARDRAAAGNARGVRALATAVLGAAHLMQGDLDAAWSCNEDARRLAADEPPTMLHSVIDFYRALTACERGALDEARASARRLVEAGEAAGLRVALAHGSAVLGRIALRAGDLAAASAHLHRALTLHLALADGWGLGLDLEWLAAVADASDRCADAARLAGAADAQCERVGVGLLGIDRADPARRAARARQQLGDAFHASTAEGRALDADDVRRLAADLAAGAAAAERVGSRPAPPNPRPGAHNVETADGAADDGAAGDDRTPRAGVTGPDTDRVPRIMVRALGALEVRVGGRPVDAAAWGSARSRELLVYLLCHPDGRTKEQIGVAFWPEASTAQVHNSFHVTLHRLRRALGGRAYVRIVQERYQIDPVLVAEFDAADFVREVRTAGAALTRAGDASTEAATSAAAALERAAARYRGALLDGEPVGDWADEFREPLRRAYAGALLALGAHHLAAERPARAADAYRRLLARDPLCEEAVQGLLRCHLALGERAEAARAYRRFAERLRAELGVAPAAATAALHARAQEPGEGAGRA